MVKISNQIKNIRKRAKITQVECSKRCGVGLRFLRELEQGKSTVRLDKINQVLNFFGYHIEAVKNEKE
ncbi:helix-turn-helix domain-containing protein [bacterium]